MIVLAREQLISAGYDPVDDQTETIMGQTENQSEVRDFAEMRHSRYWARMRCGLGAGRVSEDEWPCVRSPASSVSSLSRQPAAKSWTDDGKLRYVQAHAERDGEENDGMHRSYPSDNKHEVSANMVCRVTFSWTGYRPRPIHGKRG